MGGFAAVLPFLSQLKQQQGIPASVIPQQAPVDAPIPPVLTPQQQQALPQQQPSDPMGDLTQSLTQGGAPKLAPETKGHKLLQILFSGLKGGAAGAGQRTFGGGFQQAQELPLAIQHQQLQNQQLIQTLPFLRMAQMAGIQKTMAEAGKFGADTSKANAEVAGMPIKQALEQAQTEAANYKEDPNLGLIDLRTRQPVTNSALAPLTPEEAQILGKQPGERVPLKLKNTASEIVNRGYTTVNTEEGVYERNRGTGSMTRLGSNPRMMFAPTERIVQAVDPNNPGNVVYTKAGTAMNQGLLSPQSAPAVTAKATAKAIAPGGKVGEEVNAFKTAMNHADLLLQAARELNNPNSRTLAGIQNRLKTEFGDPDVTNFDAISHVYQNEIQKMIAGGHITNQELDKNAASVPSSANLETITKVLNSYKALAQSKLQNRMEQVDAGQHGKANFPAPQQHVIQIGNQKYQYKGQGATDDLRNYEPMQ